MSTVEQIHQVIKILQNGGKIMKVFDLYKNGKKVGELEIYLNKVEGL